MDTSGEQTTRLDRLESDIAEAKDRLSNLEKDLASVKTGAATMQSQMAQVNQKLDKVVSFVDGTDKLFGFCRKHWRTLLKFGCGFVTAYGVSNPHLAQSVNFVSRFFGF